MIHVILDVQGFRDDFLLHAGFGPLNAREMRLT